MEENLFENDKKFKTKIKYDMYNNGDILREKDKRTFNCYELNKINNFDKEKNYSFDRKLLDIRNKIDNLNRGKSFL